MTRPNEGRRVVSPAPSSEPTSVIRRPDASSTRPTFRVSTRFGSLSEVLRDPFYRPDTTELVDLTAADTTHTRTITRRSRFRAGRRPAQRDPTTTTNLTASSIEIGNPTPTESLRLRQRHERANENWTDTLNQDNSLAHLDDIDLRRSRPIGAAAPPTTTTAAEPSAHHPDSDLHDSQISYSGIYGAPTVDRPSQTERQGLSTRRSRFANHHQVASLPIPDDEEDIYEHIQAIAARLEARLDGFQHEQQEAREDITWLSVETSNLRERLERERRQCIARHGTGAAASTTAAAPAGRVGVASITTSAAPAEASSALAYLVPMHQQLSAAVNDLLTPTSTSDYVAHAGARQRVARLFGVFARAAERSLLAQEILEAD